MAYLSYTDVPLYFGNNQNSSELPGEDPSSNKGVICQQLQLNHTPNITPVRVLGKIPGRDSYNLAGPPKSTLSFTAYANQDFKITDYTGNVGDIGTTFRIGDSVNGISGSGVFLTSYSFTLSTYQPVLIQATFDIYNPLAIDGQGGAIADASSNDVIDDLSFPAYGHGAYSTLSGAQMSGGANISSLDTIESVQYSYSANRRPIYTLGNYNPQDVRLLSEEQSMKIDGDNIVNIVPLTGLNCEPITAVIKNANNIDLFEVEVQGRITAENVSIQGGDLAKGSVTVTELLK